MLFLWKKNSIKIKIEYVDVNIKWNDGILLNSFY